MYKSMEGCNMEAQSSLDIAKIKQVRAELTAFYAKAKKLFSTDETVESLMRARCYAENDDAMRNVLKEIGVIYVKDYMEFLTACNYSQYSTFNDWGTMSARGTALLNNRYVFPIRDFEGKVTALAGWNNRTPKYVVTPTYGFLKEAQFFNAETCSTFAEKGDKTVYLVEGFFDALALRAHNFCALGNFGLSLSSLKAEMLRRFDKVVVINDADKAGKKAYPYIAGTVKERNKQWHIDNVCTFVKLQLPYVKDADDLFRFYDCEEDVYNLRFKGQVFTLTEEYEGTE